MPVFKAPPPKAVFQTATPVNYPAGASSWWHLLDIRHSNTANNYALQIAGSFFDQHLWFRKTNNSANTPWSRLDMPVGSIIAYAGTTAPDGWLLCDGSSTSGHAELIALVGATTPDLRGMFVRGLDTRTSGYVDPYYAENINTARAIGNTQTDSFQGHYHSSSASSSMNSYPNLVQSAYFTSNLQQSLGLRVIDGNPITTIVNVLNPSTGTHGAPRVSTETRPRNISLNYIIKF